MERQDLVRDLKELCGMLEGFGMSYVVVGGLAVSVWAEPRATVDIDFMIGLDEHGIAAFREKLDDTGRFLFIHERPTVFKTVTYLRAVLKSRPEVVVDFLLADDPHKQAALSRGHVIEVRGGKVTICSPEDLIILQLLGGREQDLLDVDKILQTQEGLDFRYIEEWSIRLKLDIPARFRMKS